MSQNDKARASAQSKGKAGELVKTKAKLKDETAKASKRIARLAIEAGLADSNFSDAELKRGFRDMVARFQGS